LNNSSEQALAANNAKIEYELTNCK